LAISGRETGLEDTLNGGLLEVVVACPGVGRAVTGGTLVVGSVGREGVGRPKVTTRGLGSIVFGLFVVLRADRGALVIRATAEDLCAVGGIGAGFFLSIGSSRSSSACGLSA
jgi:hypothetical protein